jgi:hypothetical protein
MKRTETHWKARNVENNDIERAMLNQKDHYTRMHPSLYLAFYHNISSNMAAMHGFEVHGIFENSSKD